jgi:hypothetical protein
MFPIYVSSQKLKITFDSEQEIRVSKEEYYVAFFMQI